MLDATDEKSQTVIHLCPVPLPAAYRCRLRVQAVRMLFGFSYKQGEESEAARKHTKRQTGELRESTQRDQQWFLVLNHRSAHPKSSTGPPIYTEAMWLETDVGTLGTHSRLFSVKAYGKSNWRSMLVYSTYWVRATGGACFSLMCLVQYLLSTSN